MLALLYDAQRPQQERCVLLAEGFAYTADGDGIWRFTRRAMGREWIGLAPGRRERRQSIHDPDRRPGLTPEVQCAAVLQFPAHVQCPTNSNQCAVNRIDQETYGPLYEVAAPGSAIAHLRRRAGVIASNPILHLSYAASLTLEWTVDPPR